MNDYGGPWTDRRDELLERVVQHGRARKRRGAFMVTGTALVLVVALAAGVYFPRHNARSSLHVANQVHGSTTTTTNALPTRPAGVLLIGDALMLGAKAALERAIPGAHVDAGVSRQLGNAVGILEADKRSGTLPRTIVIHLGDNGPSGADASDQVSALFKQIMGTVGSESTVYFVDLKLPRAWESAVNAGLYAAAPQWPNAHVLDWKIGSDLHPDWFAADGFHLSPLGSSGYAEFVREGIRGGATNAEPFGGAIPSSGLAVLDDPKVSEPQQPASWTTELFDDAGNEQGLLPRAVVDNDTFNAARHEVVATDSGLHLAPRPLERGTDVPAGCTQTETVPALAVAICGARSGDQLLGDRIEVNRGARWAQLIAAPPAPPGVDHVGGHWAWASPSPDGRWVLAGWSGECEVPTSFFVSVADGSVRTVTGEAGSAWSAAPDSTNLGWTANGSAMAIFGGESGCGASASVPRGVYLVSPRDGTRPLLLLLNPSQQVLRWSAVNDRRTSLQAVGSPVSVDLDGDGRADQVRVTLSGIRANGAEGPSKLTATLADGRVAMGTVHGYSEQVLGTADIAGDGRREVLMTVGGETWTIGAIIVLDGDRLVAITTDPDGFALGWAQHTNSDPWGTTDLACAVVDGQPSLLATSSTRTSASDPVRKWKRSVYALEGAKLVLRKRDSGTVPTNAAPRPDLPLANTIRCGTAK